MRVETLTPVVTAAPGERAVWRVRVENDEAGTLGYRLRIIGFDPANVLQPPPTPPLPAGSAEELDLELWVPEAFAAGHHSIAVEVLPDRPGAKPVIAGVTVTVGRIDEVVLAVVPSTIRARRRASFRVDIDNRSTDPVALELAGAGPGLDVRMRPDSVVLRPGDRVRTKGKVRAPRLLAGAARQHSLTVSARSRSAPSYAAATFHQRPLFPHGMRSALAVLLVVAIWAGALGAGFLWWQSRDDADDQATAELVDTDGDGVVDTPADQLIDTDGDGVPDTAAGVVAEQLAAAAEETPPQPGGSDRPTRTVLGGTVQAGDSGEPQGVGVALTPIDLGAAPPPGEAPAGFANPSGAGDDDGPDKVWPSRFGLYQPVLRSGIRRTQSVPLATTTDEQGAWLFSDVAVGQSYEVSFTRPGYDTQAFVVTPTGDGKPIELAVELEPAQGSVSGRVVGPGGGVGNVELELTDGTLTFQSASASGAGAGEFSFTGVSTPGTYTLRANLRGFGTEVVQVTLEPGQQRSGVNPRIRAGVGSISGRVTADGEPLGGVTLTASNGDTTVETTSLTEGDTGSYTFPQLDIPGRYTVNASKEGYLTQTRLVNLAGNATGVDFDFRTTTGLITGLVESSNGGGLPGANVRVSRDELAFDTETASSGDPGSFTVRDLPPGTYRIEFSRFDHAPQSQVVTVAAGQVVDLGRITLEFRPRPPVVQNGSLEVRVVDSQANPLNGSTVRVRRLSDGALVAEQSDTAPEDQSSFVFQPIDIGTYQVEVTKPNSDPTQPSLYRPATRRVTVGLTSTVEVITLFKLGQASGRLVDSFTREELDDYDVQILRINPDGTPPTLVQSIPVVDGAPPRPQPPDGRLEVRFETAEASLTSGTYLVNVVNPPPGYRVVPDQVLQDGQLPMRFVISPTDDTPIDLGDIEADRFPEVAGTVLAPQLGGGGAITFEPIETDALRVTLTCPGTNPGPTSVTLETARPSTVPGQEGSGLEDTGGNPAFDSYFFNRTTLEGNDLSGECTIDVTADEYEPAQLPVIVSPGDGSSDPLVFRNVAMIRPETVGGTTYWVDRGVPAPGRVDAIGVDVRTQGNVIVDFAAGTTERTEPGSEPTAVLATVPLSQTTGAAGAWAFVDPRQVFGTSNYVFGAAGRFTNRIIAITLAESGRTVAPADGSTLAIDGSQPAIAVQLDAIGGTITSNVRVATIKGGPGFPSPLVDLSGFAVDLTGANTVTAQPLNREGPHLGGVQPAVARFPTLDPGTHTVTVRSTATDGGRPRFVLSGAQAPTFFQEPGANVALPPVTFVEQGALDVRVIDVDGLAIAGAQVTVNGPSTSLAVTTGAGPANVVAGLPVSSAIGALTPYSVSLDGVLNPLLDVSTATLRVFNETGTQLCGPPLPTCGPTFNVAQGGQPRVVIQVERFGTITGQVLGDDGTGTPVELILDPLLEVVARRIALPGCIATTAGPAVPAPPVDTDGDGVDDSFRFTGPEGLYRIEFSHPAYETTPESGPPLEPEDICADPSLSGFVYNMDNDDDRVLPTPFFTLQVLPSALTVEVRNDALAAGNPGVGAAVLEATVVVTRRGGTAQTETTNGSGEALFSLDPGAYDVAVSRVDPGGTVEYFPVGFSLSVPPGGLASRVRVPLPRIGGSITGTVIAVNSEGDALLDRVPVPTGIEITDAYNPPDPTASGATVGTVANPAPSGPVAATNAGDGLSSTYEIDPVASGVHTLSFNDAGGVAYGPPDPIAVTVLGLVQQQAPNVAYRAVDRTVVVTVRVSEATASPDGALVRLVDPDAPTAGTPQPVGGCTGTGAARVCTVTFGNVPPEQADYAAEVTKERYGTQTVTFAVDPGDPAAPVAVSATIAGTVARVTGFAEAQNSAAGANVPLPQNGDVTLFRVGQSAPVATVDHGTDGSYFFDIVARGTYDVVATAPGYAPRRTQFVVDRTGGIVDLGGQAALPTIVVPLLARFQITVEPPTARAGAAVETLVTGTATVAPAASPTATGFDVVVDPGASYRFTITSPGGFVPITVPGAPQQPPVGGTVPLSATLDPRSISGTVTGATSGIAVRASNGTTTIIGTATGSGYTIPQVPNGTWTVEAAALGSGRGTSTPVTITSSTPQVTGIGVTLAPRTVAIGFTITPGNVSIALAGGPSGTASGGSLTLDRAENTFPVQWTATADGYITQQGEVTAPSTPADPFAASLSATVPAITLQRPVMSATVRTPGTGGTLVSNATVVMCPGAVTTCTTATTGAVTLPFVAAASRYEATVTQSGTWRITATHPGNNPPATLTAFDVSAAGVIAPTPPVELLLTAP